MDVCVLWHGLTVSDCRYLDQLLIKKNRNECAVSIHSTQTCNFFFLSESTIETFNFIHTSSDVVAIVGMFQPALLQ